jgi:hypothetical protein
MTDKTVRVRMMEPIGTTRIRTTDAAVKTTANRWLSWRRTRDTLITAESPAKNPGALGHMTWQGDLQPVGAAVTAVIDALRRVKDKAQFSSAYARVVCAIADANYAADATPDEPNRPEKEFGGSTDENFMGSGATPSSVDAVNKAFWTKDRVWNPNATRDSAPRGRAATSIEDIQRQQDEYWAKQTQHQQWGRG